MSPVHPDSLPRHAGFCMPLAEAAALLDAECRGSEAELRGVSTDTRALQPGALFVALRGPNFDGHAFVDAARQAGAAAAMVEHFVPGGLPQLRVPDTGRALGALAAHWRGRFQIPVVGVTGSNGKTTVKEMLAAILARRGAVLATRGNLNNDIGVPLTLFGLDARHRGAVIEMGANHAGEIARLARLARPSVGVVTNAGAAHLEGFGSVQGVARAKGELFEALPADAVAVVNADDAHAALWLQLAAGRTVLRFGLEAVAEVHAQWQAQADGTAMHLSAPQGETRLRLALPGRHNVMNALAAAAAALAAGATLDDVRAGLDGFTGVAGRLQLRTGRGGMRLLDDSYNANPDSLAAGLEVLAGLPGRRWLVLGDMGELGPGAHALHVRAGALARACDVERLFACGPLAAAAAEGFGAGALAFDSQEALIAALQESVSDQVVALVKGSRRMHMERVVAALSEMPEGLR